MTLPTTKSLVMFGDTYYSKQTHKEVFTPLSNRETELYLVAVSSAEAKHKRLLTEAELIRIGELIIKNGK